MKCRNRNRDGTTNQKKNGFEKRFGVTTIVISGKLCKTINIKQAAKN